LNAHFQSRADDPQKLNSRLAEMISLLTCNKKSGLKKSNVSPETKEILKKMNERVQSLYAALPTNAMFIVCTGHGDTSIVHRFVALYPNLKCLDIQISSGFGI